MSLSCAYWMARTPCRTRCSPISITGWCQWILRRMQAFMFASEAFSSHFSGFFQEMKSTCMRIYF